MHFGSFMQTPSPNPLKGLRYLKVVVGGFQGPMGGGSDVLVSQREAASDKRLFPPTHDFPQEGSPHIILRPSGEARSIYIYIYTPRAKFRGRKSRSFTERGIQRECYLTTPVGNIGTAK